MAFKKCKCAKMPRCEHPWWFRFQHKGLRSKKRAIDFAAPRLKPGENPPITKAEAEQWEVQFQAWVIAGKPELPATGAGQTHSVTIEVAAIRYQQRFVDTELSDKGAKSIVKHIKAHLGTRPITALLSKNVVLDFRNDIVEDSSEVNANRHLARLSHFTNWCRSEYGLTGNSPYYHKVINPTGVKKFKEGHRSRRLDEAEETVLVKAFEELKDGGMMVGRFYCALDCGLRRGEMLKLQKDDILWKHKDGVVLRVRWGNAKSRKERFVPVATKRLHKFLDTRRFSAFPFGQLDGTRLETFREDWEEVLRLAGMEQGEYQKVTTAKGTHRKWVRTKDADLHWHDLRHECGSRFAEGFGGRRAVPLPEVQALLGHADLKTTQKYLNIRLSNLATSMREAVGAL